MEYYLVYRKIVFLINTSKPTKDMSISIGFLLVTHNKPSQFLRLVSRLNEMFNYPPIVCHHNFSITPLEIQGLSNNIGFVRPHVKTKWGKFTTIDAELKALELLYKRPDSPDWFILLSGADYPIKSAKTIIDDLSTTEFDAFMHHEVVRYGDLKSGWQKLGYQRYCIVRGWLPTFNKKGRLGKKFFTILENPSSTRFFVPFSEDFPCFVGDHFFCANRRAAQYLLEYHATHPRLESYYRRYTIFPTESYYQTILCNSPNIRVNNNNWRYMNWSKENDPHPKILRLENLPSLQESSAHFARKFDIDEDPSVFDELDKLTQ